MSKRKKKPSPEKMRKQEMADRKNDFFRKLKNLVTVVSSPGIYALIPAKELDIIYSIRLRTMRLEAGPGQNIPQELIKDAKHLLSRLLNIETVQVLADGTKITRSDYLTVGVTIGNYLLVVKDTDFTMARKFKEAMAGYSDFFKSDEGFKKSYNIQINIIQHMGMMYSDLSSHIYVFDQFEKKIETEKYGMYLSIEMYAKETERIPVTIDGSTRPVLRVGWGIGVLGGLAWIKINADDLGMETAIKGLKMDVYIQSHAIIRLAERIDCFVPGVLHINLFESLQNLKTYRDKSGNYLFEYRLFNHKIGYLRGDICEGKIIIRTFLFLTHNGTPEGERLMESTGLLKEDKEYLQIDKLSTFLSSDIRHNERVKEIFVNAGCGSLFELHRLAPNRPEDIKQKSVSALITNYLGLEVSD